MEIVADSIFSVSINCLLFLVRRLLAAALVETLFIFIQVNYQKHYSRFIHTFPMLRGPKLLDLRATTLSDKSNKESHLSNKESHLRSTIGNKLQTV